MPTTGKRKPKARPETAAPVLRGFLCAPNFGSWDEIGGTRLPYFQAQFRDGRRVPGIEPIEWDFRGIRHPDEAREAVLWEYAREVEWIYDFHGELFAALTYEPDSAVRKRAGDNFFSKWTINGGSADPLFQQHGRGLVFFPIPWLQLPPEGVGGRKPPMHIHGPDIRSLTVGEFAERSERKGRNRAHALEIDWSMPSSNLVSAFKVWMRANRPKDVRERKRSGTDPKDIFAKLKRLAAYRLKRAGLSRSKALELICERTRAVPTSNPFDVLPCYQSEGRWSSSVKEAAEYMARWFPVPREGEFRAIWPDDPRC